MKLSGIRISPILLVLTSFSVTDCAIGPLSSYETARTVGRGKAEILGGYGNLGMTLKANFGLAENWDLGIHWETLNFGLLTKYAFIQNVDHGWSFSGSAGTGASFGGIYYTLAGTTSYLSEIYEPYLTLRAGRVTYSGSNQLVNHGYTLLNLPELDYSYDYLESIVGSRFWVTPNHFFFSVEVAGVWIGGTSAGIASGGLGYRF